MIPNGEGSGIATARPILSSLDGVAPSPYLTKRGKRGSMTKQYKESEYSKKLRDPRWQKMRLEILSRDEFTCQKCFDSESTLNVHHCYYEYGKEPWDYPAKSLVTLCETCHEEESAAADVKSDLILILSQRGLLYQHFHDLCTGFIGFDFNSPEHNCSMLGWALADPEMKDLIHEKYNQHIHEVAEQKRREEK